MAKNHVTQKNMIKNVQIQKYLKYINVVKEIIKNEGS